MKIFFWTYHNIKKQPEELPVVDDHVWHIVVRGYGVYDQRNDVFSTLCNYAGLSAFYSRVRDIYDEETVLFSFVEIAGN